MSQNNAIGTSGTKRTLIEDETEFKGVFSSKCPIVVRGTIDGEVAGPSLHVSPSGSVSGTVKVQHLHSEGTLSGRFEAEEVELSGVVKDKTVIRARSMEVKLSPDKGALEVTFGECELEVGEVPDKEDAVAAARGKDGTADAAHAEDKPAAAGESKERAEAATETEAAAAETAETAEAVEDGKKNRKDRKRRDSTSPAPA